MKRYVIVSTYPAEGSRNIGDSLITESLVSMIRATAKEELQVDVVWRQADWNVVSETILAADHIFFACLAIRREMRTKTYPFAEQIVSSGITYSIHAAGTDLRVKDSMNLFETIDEESVIFLRELALYSKLFTTRGVLTQTFCRTIGIDSAEYAGDIAFYAPEMYGVKFNVPSIVKNIVVSDPHRTEKYVGSFVCLLAGLPSLFPQAVITVALHGVNPEIEAECITQGVDCISIFEDAQKGLSIYDNCDLHVGYRVHGHVSALKRRKLSYLLEQDGRGADYGLTLSRKISVPNYLQFVRDEEGKRGWTSRASVSPPQQLLGMIGQDLLCNFDRFDGFEREIEKISRRSLKDILTVIDIDSASR